MSILSKNKKVHFNNIIIEHITYSSQEYDRLCIDHVLYRKAYNRFSDNDMINLYLELDKYKLHEMIIHKNAFSNNTFHFKKFNYSKTE